MRCAILSTYDIQGGASRAAYRLHKGLLGLGIESAVLSRHKKSADATVHQVQLAADDEHRQAVELLAQAQRRLADDNRTPISNTFFSLAYPGYDLSIHPVVQQADVLNLHWTTNLLCTGGVAGLVATGKPVVWTLHDQRPFTGGCHFSAGCHGYETTCSDCPQLSDPSSNPTAQVLTRSARLLAPGDLTFVAPSRWMAECARRSRLLARARIEHIPYGLELELYRPLPKRAAKEALGIAPETTCLLFGADSCGEQRKGFRELRAALSLCLSDPGFQKRVATGQLQILCFGYGSEKEVLPGLPVKPLGHLESDAELCQAYSAAELFLFASLEDNLPNTILEAMACGTAVIANQAGGVPELITHGQTGFLARVTEPGEFARAICEALNHPERIAVWQRNALALIRERHGLELQARRYRELFGELINVGAQQLAKPMHCTSETAPLVQETLRFVAEEFLTPSIPKLERVWAKADGTDYRPSFRLKNTFINREHEQLAQTFNNESAPGLQKAYELGFYCGEVILEIGGRGDPYAGVALRGANAAARVFQAQCYRLEIGVEQIQASVADLAPALFEQCLFYLGHLQQFRQDLPIVPSMVLVKAGAPPEELRNTFSILERLLAPDTPLLCVASAVDSAMRQTLDEVSRSSRFQVAGFFGNAVLLRAGESCRGKPRGLPAEDFKRLRRQLLDRYRARNGAKPAGAVAVADLTAPMKEALLGLKPGESERRPWPYSAPWAPTLPSTLPNGKAWPRITVVTPSFNQGRYLEETILSVLNQRYPNLEYLVMDGGSTDQTVSILRRYESRLDFWASEKDRGQCHAINKGFARSTGEILTWLNSDDMLAPGALAAVALGFHLSGADMVAGVCQLQENGVLLREHLTSCPDGPLGLEELLDQEHCWDKGQFFYQPEVFFRRGIWERAGARLDESLYFSLDYELWLRFAQAGAQLKVLGCPLAIYRVHANQKTYTVDRYRPELRKVRAQFLAGKAYVPAARVSARVINTLRVVLVNDVGPRFGAGIAQERLGQALSHAGHDVLLLGITVEKVAGAAEAASLSQRLLARLHREHPDAVVLGNLHGSHLGGDLIGEVATHWPTVFMLHDCWLLTGRCIYMGGCEKYLTQCDRTCPTFEEYPALEPDEILPAWERKQRLLAEAEGLVLAANSHWVESRAQAVLQRMKHSGRGVKAATCVVRYGLPLHVFKPRDRQLCREILGLPQDRFVVLFSCANLGDARKGAAHLVEALRRVTIPGLLPVCVGHGAEPLRYELPDLLAVPYTTEPLRQALLYAAADLFIGPSLQEAFGQVFIEAAACGTPTVAYHVGGVPEAAIDGLSARLAQEVTPEALARTIAELYHQPHLCRQLGAWGHLYARSHFSLQSSCRSLCSALRQALASRGVELAPTLRFQPRPSALRVEYLVPPVLPNGAMPSFQELSQTQLLEAQMQDYFQHRLDAYRRGRLPWVLRPGAWLARINRDRLRKAARRWHPGTGI